MSMLCLLVLQTALAPLFLSGIFYTFYTFDSGQSEEQEVVRFNGIMYIKGDHLAWIIFSHQFNSCLPFH